LGGGGRDSFASHFVSLGAGIRDPNTGAHRVFWPGKNPRNHIAKSEATVAVFLLGGVLPLSAEGGGSGREATEGARLS
jgi:hypothetical protein